MQYTFPYFVDNRLCSTLTILLIEDHTNHVFLRSFYSLTLFPVLS